MGVRFPLPAPSNLFICNMLQGREVLEENPCGTNTVHSYPAYFQSFTVSELWFGHCHLNALPPIYIDCPNIRLFTVCAADNRIRHRGKTEGNYVVERTF